MITDMLQAVVERGTAKRAFGSLGKDVVFAGKTGSSKDGWFVGYTPNLVTVAWIGLDDNDDIGATGGEVALPLWVDFMQAVVQIRPEFGGEYFPMPKGLSEITVDPETGMMADVYCPQSEKVIVPTGAVSGVKCLKHQPPIESYVASNEELQINSLPKTIEISPTVYENVESKPKNENNFKEVNDVPSEKVEDSGRKMTKPEINKTYIEDYEKQKIKSKSEGDFEK